VVVCRGRDGELRGLFYCGELARLSAALGGQITDTLDGRVLGVELPARGHGRGEGRHGGRGGDDSRSGEVKVELWPRWQEAGCVVAGVVGRRRTVVATARLEIPARRSGAWGTDTLSGTVHASSHAARYTHADMAWLPARKPYVSVVPSTHRRDQEPQSLIARLPCRSRSHDLASARPGITGASRTPGASCLICRQAPGAPVQPARDAVSAPAPMALHMLLPYATGLARQPSLWPPDAVRLTPAPLSLEPSQMRVIA
jgi:hypothetical protein